MGRSKGRIAGDGSRRGRTKERKEKTKKWKCLKVSIEKDKDGSYIAYNTNSDKYTLVGRGNTEKEARADFMESMRGVAEMERETDGRCSGILVNEPEFKQGRLV